MLSKARSALEECEERLRVLLAEAAASGQYDALETITEWARTLGRLREGGEKEPVSSARDDAELLVAPRVVGKRLKARQAYPRFTRSRNELVKIGWSKKDKKEYVHRAPWGVVELLCQRLNDWDSKEFTSDDILPLVAVDGVEVPSYQVYLCLAWLRELGLITKEGRQGYFVPRGVDVTVECAKVWKILPSNR
ncbi:MAG: hypothetical protein ACK6D3_05110 [Planctomycetaceae bacterium]